MELIKQWRFVWRVAGMAGKSRPYLAREACVADLKRARERQGARMELKLESRLATPWEEEDE